MRKKYRVILTVLAPFLLLFCFTMATGAQEIEIIRVTPRMMELDQEDFFERVSTGHHVVAIGEPIYVQVGEDLGSSFTDMNWAFTSQPSDSETSFVITNATKTAFRPDKEGKYELKFVASDGENEIVLTRTILAAVYVGSGAVVEEEAEFPQCMICHTENAEGWQQTAHAQVFRKVLRGEAFDDYEASFFQWHTVGFHQDPRAVNSGFDDVSEANGVDLDGLVEDIREARHVRLEDPDNEIDLFPSLPNQVKERTAVQCEECHGPGSQHFAQPDQIGFTWTARFCVKCHDDPDDPAKQYAYDSSVHGKMNPLFEEFPLLQRFDCAKCHSTEGFVNIAVEDTPENIIGSDEPIEMHSVSCAACHDPHHGSEEGLLRTQGDMTLESGAVFADGGKGSLCVICHDSRIGEDLENYIDVNRAGPHYGPQADVMLGINAWDYGMEYSSGESIHKLVVEDTCVACHMAETPHEAFSMEEGPLLGGHSFKLRNDRGTPTHEDDIDNVRNSCFPCHLTLDTLDRPTPPRTDYDGNGRSEGIQTEVMGLMDQIVSLLKQRYPRLEIMMNGDLNVPTSTFQQMTFEEKAAVHNYQLIFRDGSWGIHNPAFVVEVLQRTLNSL